MDFIFFVSAGFLLPKGCSVNMCLHKLHKDPKLFPNPDIFDPDRFSPDKMLGRNPFAFCPFSAGSRNCVGE